MMVEVLEPVLCSVILQDSESYERVEPSFPCVVTVVNTPHMNSLVIIRGTFLQTEFKLDDLIGLYIQEDLPDRFAMRFESTKRNVIVLNDDVDHIAFLFNSIYGYIVRKNRQHIVNDGYNLDLPTFSCMERFHLELNVNHLSTVKLENVTVMSLEELAIMPSVTHISLSKSILGVTKLEKETFWKWMSYENVYNNLTVLLMDSIELEEVPFEMQNLSKLETLSLANNKLKSIPHFFGDLTSLTRLFINQNNLTFLPFGLQKRDFQDVNFADNKLKLMEEPDYRPHPETVPRNPEKLTNLAMFSLLKNKVKLNRKDINRPLWKYFNNISPCRQCKKLIVVYLENAFYDIGFVSSFNYQCDANIILWQYAECRFRCKE